LNKGTLYNSLGYRYTKLIITLWWRRAI